MNILIDRLPETVHISGREYPINWGFRACMLIEIDMFSDREDEQKVLDALNIFYFNQIPDNQEEAMERLLDFYSCGKRQEKKEGSSECGSLRKNVRRAYDFESDAMMIYAAFKSQYGIDLNDIRSNDLHWWKFQAMFDSLDENHLISKVMYYRTVDLKGMSKNKRAFIKKMREIYKIERVKETLDDATKLAKRNANMKEYVRRRMAQGSK